MVYVPLWMLVSAGFGWLKFPRFEDLFRGSKNCVRSYFLQDTRRKFIWEEMSYLERWWRDASELKRETFTKLVKNGQLEIVGGGWVMNDEVSQRTIHVTPYELRIFVPSLLLNDWMACNNFWGKWVLIHTAMLSWYNGPPHVDWHYQEMIFLSIAHDYFVINMKMMEPCLSHYLIHKVKT